MKCKYLETDSTYSKSWCLLAALLIERYKEHNLVNNFSNFSVFLVIYGNQSFSLNEGYIFRECSRFTVCPENQILRHKIGGANVEDIMFRISVRTINSLLWS